MSATASVTAPEPARSTPRTSSRLRLVPPTRPETPLAPFVVLLFLLLAGGVAGLLAFNTSMQQSSFTATRLEKQADGLTAQRQSLQLDLSRVRDPQRLATRAKQLGMVPSTSAGFVRLRDGRILGDPQPARPDQAMRINSYPAAVPKVLAPKPRVVRAPSGKPPRGSDRPVRSTTTNHTR